MKGEEYIIKFVDDKAYLTEDYCLTLSQVDLPETIRKFKKPAYWKFRVINHIIQEKRIFCEILTYNMGEINFSENQIRNEEKLKQVEKISFRSIDTIGLLRTSTGTQGPISLKPRKPEFIKENVVNEPDTSEIYSAKKSSITEPTRLPVIEIYKETIEVPFKEVNFKFGCVSFSKKIKRFNSLVNFEILNYDIREEFDAIKNYFANILKTKKITVEIEIEITDKQITKVNAKSIEISKINNALIESVKFEFVRNLSKNKIEVEIHKALFTMDELFDAFEGDKIKASTFYNDELDLFEDLLQISNTKHYKHLRFLSSKHAHTIMKLRFIIKPFSFIFLIEGENNYHIIWETLDTREATYIWHIDKDLGKLKLATRKIEDTIKVIKIEGKTAYINSSDDNYKRIYHDYSDLIDGFVKWKGELESILT